jgi:hypothetical protein
MPIDYNLLWQVRQLTTGANSHELAFFEGAYICGCREAETFLRRFVATGDLREARKEIENIREERGLR